MEIHIASTPEEMEQVYRLRYDCYVEELGWRYKDADRKTRELRDDLDAKGTIFYAEDGRRVVATFCVHFAGGFELPAKWRDDYALDRFSEYPASSLSFGSRLMVVPELRNSTVVPRILLRAYEECWNRGTRFSFCWCRPRLIDLYERLGFIRYKDNIFDANQGYVTPMVLMNEDADHLKRVRSPTLKICLTNRPCTQTAEWFDSTFPGLRMAATRKLYSPDEFWQEWSEAMDAKNVALLQGLNEEQVRALLNAGTVLKCRAGDTLLREDEPGHEMFLILEGMARMSRSRSGGRECLIGMAGKGEVFGEMALASRHGRSATVKAETDMQVLVISQDFLHRAMKSLPEVAMRLLYNLNGVLCDKLLNTTHQWQEALHESEKAGAMIAA